MVLSTSTTWHLPFAISVMHMQSVGKEVFLRGCYPRLHVSGPPRHVCLLTGPRTTDAQTYIRHGHGREQGGWESRAIPCCGFEVQCTRTAIWPVMPKPASLAVAVGPRWRVTSVEIGASFNPTLPCPPVRRKSLQLGRASQKGVEHRGCARTSTVPSPAWESAWMVLLARGYCSELGLDEQRVSPQTVEVHGVVQSYWIKVSTVKREDKRV